MKKRDKFRANVEDICLRYADNCIYNYVTILTWLRVVRYLKVLLLLCPIFVGVFASWLSLTSIGNATIAAFFSILAGFFSTLYIAIGIEERIIYFTQLCGKYRAIGLEFRNLGQASQLISTHRFKVKFDTNFKSFKELRHEAYTLPKWCYRRARNEIENGNYELLSAKK